MIHTRFDIDDKVVLLETGIIYTISHITVDIWKYTHQITYGMDSSSNHITCSECCIGTPQEWYDRTVAKLCKASVEAAAKLLILMKEVKQ